MLRRMLLGSVLLSISFSLRLANAQVTAVAQVSGTVSDPSGATIANAHVSMVDIAKQIPHTTLADATGNYALPNLPVGQYRLEVRAPGFKDYAQTGIELVVNNNIQINVTMQIGSATETVEVTGAAGMVETKENSVANLVDEKRINELPLNGRQVTDLIYTVGAAVPADAGDTGSKTFWNATRISIAGGQGNGTAYLLDGADATDAMSNVNLPFPFPDALQEFSIETSAVSSQFGTHPGATVNVVTKSGSNSLHGNAFEYLRNGDTNARNFFSTTGADTIKRNTFGGTIGGRIIKDKLFFFGGIQVVENRQNPPQLTTHIPTSAMLNGDFSVVASATCGKAVALTNPSGGAPFPGNQIPVNLMDPAALKLASSYLPTAAANGCGTVTYGIPQTGDEQQWIERTDWVVSAKQNLWGRYFFDHWTNPPVLVGNNLLTTTSPGNYELAQEVTIGDSYTFTPTLVNTVHVGFNRRRDNRGPTDFAINWTGLGSNMYSAVPNFLLISGMTGGFTTYCGTCAPGHFNINDYQVADDVNWMKGRHQIGLGFNVIRVQNNTISGFDENGAPTWNGQYTGLGMADFLIGKMSDFQQTNATPDDLRTWVMSFYAQDSIRVNNRFTLNLGLRWEPTFADPDKYRRGNAFLQPAFLANQVSSLHPSAPAGLFFPGDPGIPAANWNGQKANFAPRVGMVWNPSGQGKDTLRVGAALLYDATETWFNERETTNPPYGNDIDVGAGSTISNPWSTYPGGNPFPQNGNLFFPTSGTYISMPINPKSTYVVNWNATYQRQIGKDWMVSASYLGNKTSHLWIALERDPAIYVPGNCTAGQYGLTAAGPCSSTAGANVQARRLLTLMNPVAGPYYASVDLMDDGAVARYQGLLLSAQHRVSHNFTFLANYTYSYCLSDYDFGAALAGSTNSQIFNRHADWGPCISDARHLFNVSGVFTSTWNSDSKVMKALLGGWELAPLFKVRSGQPLNVTTGTDNSRTALGTDRPVQVMADYRATNPTCSSNVICVQWINPAAFTANAIGSYGDVGRNALRGPGFFGFDLQLSRTFQVRERLRLQVIANAFNILNHTNFVGAFAPAGLAAGSSYGTVSTGLNSSTFGQVTGAYDPRIFQFAMKLSF
ncbi:MAG TPA: carboxypeptidase-like regulatory domain-containing protein [Candidatus Acidoferrales bacterium]|nr:carboxypeptidase-like regulatory domain-containing protein [Candidatus Acidoferrales bacterium]